MPDDTAEDGANATRRTFMKATGGAAAAATTAGTATAADAGDASPDVDQLLRRLTLRQKAGQMTQITLDSFDPEELPEALTDPGVGSILNGASTPPTFDAGELVENLNELQEYVMEETDHGIPFVYGLDAVHGNATVDGATVFPHNVGLGATRNVDLVRETAEITGRSVEAVGAHWTFSPAADLQRDARWGRFFEGYSEDPYLTGAMARASVEGYEGTGAAGGDGTGGDGSGVDADAYGDGDASGDADVDEHSVRIGACAKHFAGYSVPRSGADRNPANTSMRELRDSHFPPFEMALAAEPETVMVNSGSVNGIPAHGSAWLLTSVLRDRWGYEGLVLSDWKDFARMVDMHEYVPTLREAVERGIDAGVDLYMNPDDATEFVDIVVDLVESGELSEERIDEAVRRILQFKANLGLLEDPIADENRHEEAVGAGEDLAQTAAQQSMTLLENEDDALPLSTDPGTLLLTGPATDSVQMQMGGWTLGWQSVGEGFDIDAAPRSTTIYEAVSEAVDDATDLRHEQTGYDFSEWWAGVEFTFDDETEAAVASAAEDADTVVLALGEAPHSEGYGDRQDLRLPEPQRRLVETVVEATDDATTLIGVLVAGSPRGSAATFDQLDAVLMAYQPGTAGGPAVSNALFGDANPSGRLAFTWPTTVGQEPTYYDAMPPRNEGEPLYAFGHGLSYTEFEYDDLALSSASVADPSEQPAVTLEATVTNAGDRAGEHVVDVHATESYGSVIHPDRRLLGSERVDLEPGESTRVAIDCSLRALEVVPGDVPGILGKTVEAGDYTLAVGEETTTLTIESSGPISGHGPLAHFDDVNDDGRIGAKDLRELMTGLLSGGRNEDDRGHNGRGASGPGNHGAGRRGDHDRSGGRGGYGRSAGGRGNGRGDDSR